jgi:hypothetical protein
VATQVANVDVFSGELVVKGEVLLLEYRMYRECQDMNVEFLMTRVLCVEHKWNMVILLQITG